VFCENENVSVCISLVMTVIVLLVDNMCHISYNLRIWILLSVNI